MERECPRCKSKEQQMNNGHHPSGTQKVLCGRCRKTYTEYPLKVRYSQEEKELAIKEYMSGISGRGVGKIHGMSKANVYNWIKKTPKK